jgi:phosphohistidine phosphatase
MNLYIIRHAIAVESNASDSEEDDLQRPLTDKGRDRMRKIAQGLWELDVQPGVILTSPATRTMDTARIVGSRLGVKKDKVIASDHLLPNGNAAELVREIHEKYADVDTLAIVGHEPYLSGLISSLLSGSTDMSLVLKKGGVCHLSLDTLQYGKCATLHWLMAPAQLVYIGENS